MPCSPPRLCCGSGHLPDWGQYLAYLQAFLFGRLGDLTYDYARWSPGLAVGAAYLSSACVIAVLVTRRPGLVRRERIAMLALVGMTAYGVAIYSYFNNRSTANTLINVALPGLILGGMWLGLLLRSKPDTSDAARRGGLGFALAVGGASRRGRLVIDRRSLPAVGAGLRDPGRAVASRSHCNASGICRLSTP